MRPARRTLDLGMLNEPKGIGSGGFNDVAKKVEMGRRDYCFRGRKDEEESRA
jgi:hypothetical protein